DWTARPLFEGLGAPRFLPAVGDLVTALAAESERLGLLHDMASYTQAGDELENIATAFVVQALQKLGMDFEPGAQLTFGALAESLGIEEHHHRLLGRMLAMLEQDGVLVKRGRLWQVARSPEAFATDAALSELTARFPNMAGEIGMVRRCGSALAEVLTGSTDPLGLLFPANDEGAGVFYQTSAYAHTVNGLLQDATERIAASLPAGRALRVLEVGGGTGGATTAILAGLAGVAFSYTFTDVSPAFLNEALKKFAGSPITPRLLDIERHPAEQGFAEHGFDLIVAANVLHATRDIAQSLTHVNSLLAEGGALLLVESTAARRWVDILFGLTGGWWRFEDTRLRPAHPLLSHTQWHDVLQATGFEPGENASTEVIVARSTSAATTGGAASPGWYVGGLDELGLPAALELAGQRCVGQNEAGQWVIMVGPIEASPDAQATFLHSLVELVQVALSQYETPALTLIASDALGHAGLPGFIRSLAIEHPALKPRLLLNPPSATSLVDELVGGASEPEVRWSGASRQVTRISTQVAGDVAPVSISGAWLITGGYGGLGLEIARWLAAHGASRIVLLGRRKPVTLPDILPALLANSSAIIEAREGDAADGEMLARILDGIEDMEGVVHAAGALSDAPIVEQFEQTIHAVLHPKIAGALALDRAVQGRAIKHFVLFASAAGIVGSANQVNHGFGSTFLDALAHSRRSQGLPGLSLDWGVWSGVGAAARKGFDQQAEQLGLGSITPAQGALAFGTALAAGPAQLLVLPSVDWQRFTGHLGALCPPLYELVLQAQGKAAEHLAEAGKAVAVAHTAHAVISRDDASDALARVVGGLLSLPRDFDRDIPLAELGLDSLVAVEIKNQVLRELGVELSVRELIEGATLSELALRIADSAEPETPAAVQADITPDLANRYQPFPLTDMQQAFWVGRRADLALGGVNCYLYTEFDTRMVDVKRLENAWNVMVKRHDMLRVVIQADGMQRILQEVSTYRFETCDLRQQPAAEVQGELARLRSGLARRVTEPGSWPLFDIRVTLFEDLTRLHIGFDLIALDAASIFALRQELGQLYDEPGTQLAPIGLSFRDYVLHLQAARNTAQWQQSEQYWKARALSLPDAPEMPLAAATTDAQNNLPEFKRHLVRVEAHHTEALKRQAQERGLTLPSVLAATYADVLAMWSRSAQFCLTVTLFNRPPLHPDMASMMGDFTSTLLLEVDTRPATFTDRAQTLMHRLASDIDHSDINGIQVLREVARQNGQGLRTIPVVFTSTLGFRRPSANAQPASEGTLWDRLGTTVYNVSSTPQIWIDHQISEEDGNLLCHWDVLQGVFPAGVVDDMMLAYRKILDALVEGSGWDKPVSAATLVAEKRPPLQAIAAA
ncbi:MAG: KR domain-containing protein, partial [Pseudomonadota bacterium]